MRKKLRLTKIELETKDGKKVVLSMDEARELHGQLDDLFGAKYVPSAPVIIERDCWPWRKPYRPIWYDVTCASETAGASHESAHSICKLEGSSGLNATYIGSAAE